MKAYGMCIGAELAVVAVLFRCFAALAGVHLNAPVALVQRVMSVAVMGRVQRATRAEEPTSRCCMYAACMLFVLGFDLCIMKYHVKCNAGTV